MELISEHEKEDWTIREFKLSSVVCVCVCVWGGGGGGGGEGWPFLYIVKALLMKPNNL